MPSFGTNTPEGQNKPYLDIKKNVGGAFDQVTQPIQGILDPYQRGITDTVGTRNATNDMLQAYGQGERARINQDFATAANNAAGRLASRGFGGSSLQLTEALGVERDRNLALGQLNDRVINTQLGNSLNYAQLIAGQTGQSGDASVSLMRALLGLNESTQQSSGGSGGGGGGGGFGSSVGDGTNDTERAYNALPPLTNPFLPGGGFTSGGGQQAGGGGGSGGGGSSGGGGGATTINNPYFPPGGFDVTEGSEAGKNYDPIPPTGPIPLIAGDQGPRLTPDIYKENQKRQAQAEAEGRPVTYTYEGPVGG